MLLQHIKFFKFRKSSFITFIFIIIVIHSVYSYSHCTTQQSSCLICPIQCTKCNSTFVCTSCSQQYYLFNGLCLPCSQYCLSCNNSTACIQCKDPFILIDGKCEQCVVANALTCASTISASSCAVEYYLNLNYCSSCLLNCKICISSSTCSQCISNFYLNNTVLTCNPCPNNCISCNQFTPTICTSCQKGYELNAQAGTCGAIDCTGVNNCKYCSSTKICGRCQILYYWDGVNCIIGASTVCDYGATGPLPSDCINDCSLLSYKSQSSSPFLCSPYLTVKIKTTKMHQLYYYAYSDQSDFRLLSETNNSIQLQSSGQYSFSTTKMNLRTIDSFYKIQIRGKYIASSSVIMTLKSNSQQNPSTVQSELTALNISSYPISFIYITRFVHSNNIEISFSQQTKLIQLYLIIYKCPETCLQCLNTNLCELCVQPQYMLGYNCVSNCTIYYHFAPNRTCLLNCPDAYYYSNGGTNNKFCIACVSPCSNCLDQKKCLSCQKEYFFYNYSCSIQCPNKYYSNLSSSMCESCVSPCKTCTSKTNCLSCDEGYWNGQTCTMVCSSGKYGDNLTQNCQSCHSSCLTCANVSTSCSSCISTLYFHNKQCILQCPERYYPSSSAPLTCTNCKPPCQSCSSQTSCITCAYNFFSNGLCIAECPTGYFQDLSGNACTKCSQNCKACSSISSCDSCPSDKCLFQGQCITNCLSSKWYKRIETTVNQCNCQECSYPCKQCLSATVCLSCLQGYLQNASCLTQCPATYHKNDTNNQCVMCSTTFSNCQQCTQLKCTLCQSSYLLYLGKCLTECPQYYYEINQNCSKCIAPCLQCTGFSVCTSCIDDYFYHNKQCIVSCPAGRFAESAVVNGNSVMQCGACSSPCLYCIQKSTKCTFCESSYYLYNNACYKNCSTIEPVKTLYNQPVASSCSKCIFPCKTCIDQYSCLSCMIGYLNTVDKKCKQCQVGTFPNNTLGECKACPISCLMCYSDTYCTNCNDGYYLFQYMCISNLSICEMNGYYGISRVCALCQQPCKTCTIAANNCTSCLSGYSFFVSTHQCLSLCPANYFKNSTTGECNSCNTSCTSCVGSAGYCFGCMSGFKLYIAEMKCLDICPQYTFSEGSFCTSCKYPCLQCTSQSSCTSCISGSLVEAKCMSSCLSGFFSNKQMICQTCSSTCKQCTSASAYCTQCPSNTFLYNNSCVEACPSRTFAQQQSQKCIGCMGTCLYCSSHINCTGCSNGFYFYSSIITNYGQCVLTCPNGFYPSSIESSCLQCLLDCLTCANEKSCLLCKNGKVQHNGSCLLQCPERMYGYQGICQNCQQPCYNCTDTTTCTSCKDSSYLFVGSAQCMEGPICPVGYFLLQNEKKCNSRCPADYYNLKSNRTCNSKGCANDQFKGVDYYCYQQCPNNYIGNSELYCESCSGSSCKDGLFFSIEYQIKNDDILIFLILTQTPKYLVSSPVFTMSPSIEYSLAEYLTVSENSKESRKVAANIYTEGSKKITLTLNPANSLQETYLKVRFENPLQSFQNPLQHSYSILFLAGYDKYNNNQLSDLSMFGMLALFCSIIGLFKNPFMTDFAQLLWIMALNNIHYPLNLRSFLESTSITFLHGFLSIKQPNMQSSGKFKYIVNDGLLENAFGNIAIILLGLIVAAVGFSLWKFLQWRGQWKKIDGKVFPHYQQFITNQQTKGNSKQAQQTRKQPNNLPISERIKYFLSNMLTIENFKILYLNRFIYFNYLPITLFTFTQLSNVDTTQIVNALGFVAAILMLFFIFFIPFTFIKDEPKFTFLYARKIATALGLMLSVNYPAYCIGVFSVCNITALVLILSYKLEKWRVQTQFYAIGEGLQAMLMIGFAIFIMIGEGYKTQFKAYFGYILVFICVGILLFYTVFAVFLLVLQLIRACCGIDYVSKWIQQRKLNDSDGTNSQTLNSSMKDHEQKKKKIEKKQDEINWNKVDQTFNSKQVNSLNYIKTKTNGFLQTKKIEVQPSKIQNEQRMNNELFWNYETNSEQQQNEKDNQLPQMLIRCVNQFSDIDNNEKNNIN